MYSLQNKKDLTYNNLNNFILQEQKEYEKLIDSYNLIFKICSFYKKQIKTHRIEFENLKNKILEIQDLQEISNDIDKIFDEFNIKNHTNNVRENVIILYNYISQLYLTNQENIKRLEENNNIELLNKIKQLEEENKVLLNKNIELNQINSELNEEINKLINLEDEYNDYKVKQEELLKISNKTINEIHRKEIINLNEIQKQRIEENKKLLKINEDLSKEVIELKKGFADLDEYKKQIILLSKDVKTIKNSVSVQNFNEINNFDQNKYLIENNQIKSPKEQLKEWFSKIDNKNRIRKQDIPDIQFKNTSLILLLCKARKYYNLDNTDKMTYGQFKNYLYTISEIRNELL